MINLESSTLIGGHLTMIQSGGEFDQSPEGRQVMFAEPLRKNPGGQLKYVV